MFLSAFFIMLAFFMKWLVSNSFGQYKMFNLMITVCVINHQINQFFYAIIGYSLI